MARSSRDTGDALDPSWHAHPDFTDHILGRVENLVLHHAGVWRGTLFRFEEPQFARRSGRLLGLGAKEWGGRWNPKGISATYGATSRDVALAEVYGKADKYGFDAGDLTPRTLFAFEADLKKVVDLTDGRNRQRLQVSMTTMINDPWIRSRKTKRESLTQAIGRAAWSCSCEGLLVPNRYGKSSPNVVIFPGVYGVSARLKTIHADKM